MQDSETARWREYSVREAENPGLGAFEGGAPPNAVWIGVAIFCVLVIGIYWLFIDPGKIKPGA